MQTDHPSGRVGRGSRTLNADETPAPRSALRIALPTIAPRAVVVWALARLVFVAVVLAAGMPPESFPAPPAAVVLLAGALGVIDVHVRGERILWANLGAGATLLCMAYATAAVAGEIALAVALALAER